MPWPDDDTAVYLPGRMVDAFRQAALARIRNVDELGELLDDTAEARRVLAEWERAGLASREGGDFRLRDPGDALVHYLGELSTRLRTEFAGLRQLAASSRTLSTIWRESFENDTSDYTIDRIDDDGRAWFAWWAYLIEHPGTEASAIVSNLDALALMESAAPGHLERLLAMLGIHELALRLIVPPRADTGEPAALMTRLVAAGAEVRIGETAGWFAVTSGTAALIPAVWGRDRSVSALLVREPSIIAGLEELFQRRWRDATRWGLRGADAVDPVVAELCRGRTDEEVAGIFGMSVRSVRRRVAAAMEATGSSSRMELGHRLGRADRIGPAESDAGDARAGSSGVKGAP